MTEKPLAPFPCEKFPAPGIIWHYTSVDVLEYFLRGEIAFSHCRFLNDDAELLYGRKLLEDIFDNVKDGGLKKFFEGEIVDKFVADAYLFCLSRDGDNLYQWRSYTPQGGIAVGFDRQKLYSALHSGMLGQKWLPVVGKINGMLLSCRYNDGFAQRVISMLNRESTFHRGCCRDGCKCLELFLRKSIRVLFSQKNPSFKDEREERFVLAGVPRDRAEIIKGKPRIIVSDSGIPEVISCVCMSPHGDRERNRLLVEFMRDKYALKYAIVQSKSSFNGR